MLLINNEKYEIVNSEGDLRILKKDGLSYLFNMASKKFELSEYKYLNFEYTTPLLSGELKRYDKNQLNVIQARKSTDKGSGILCIHREDGINVSKITNPIPMEYGLIHITTRGAELDVDSDKYNEKCIVYVGNGDGKGLYVFTPQYNDRMCNRKILSYQVPCCFDEICEYYNFMNEYFKWWREREDGKLQYFYVRKGMKCGVYNALEGKFEVEPRFDQISPHSNLTGYKATKGHNQYIIIDGEEYIARDTLLSKMLITNELKRKQELEKLLMLDEESRHIIDLGADF